MRLPRTLTRAVMLAAGRANLTPAEVAAAHNVPLHVVRVAAYRAGVLLAGQVPQDAVPRPRLLRHGEKSVACACGVRVVPAPNDRVPIRCCLCRAGRVHGMLAARGRIAA